MPSFSPRVCRLREPFVDSIRWHLRRLLRKAQVEDFCPLFVAEIETQMPEWADPRRGDGDLPRQRSAKPRIEQHRASCGVANRQPAWACRSTLWRTRSADSYVTYLDADALAARCREADEQLLSSAVLLQPFLRRPVDCDVESFHQEQPVRRSSGPRAGPGVARRERGFGAKMQPLRQPCSCSRQGNRTRSLLRRRRKLKLCLGRTMDTSVLQTLLGSAIL